MTKWIIFGTSPFVNEIKNFGFTNRYKAIGINNFYNCPCDYRCAYDEVNIAEAENKKLSGLRIYNKKAVNRIIAENRLFLGKKIEIQTHYLFDYSPQIVTEECGKLYGCKSSAIPAINYAILQGAKEVYLIGVDFNWNKGHCYDPTKAEKRQEDLLELRRNIKQLTNYVDIYRVNPEPFLPLSFLPLQRIEEL